MSDLSFPGDAGFGGSSPPWRRRRRRPGPLIVPLIVGGAIAAVVLVLRSPVASWIRGFLSEIPQPADPTGLSLLDRGLSRRSLQQSLVGRGKSAVAAVCGVPRTAANSGNVVIGRQPNFWSADTWYYPIDSQAQTAMAIRFEHGIARAVEFFDAPRAH